MKNAILTIKDSDNFSRDIWQCDGDFSTEEWKVVIDCFAENLQTIYDWLGDSELFDNIDFPFDPYMLGDTINMLQSIDIKRKGRKTEGATYLRFT